MSKVQTELSDLFFNHQPALEGYQQVDGDGEASIDLPELRGLAGEFLDLLRALGLESWADLPTPEQLADDFLERL